MNLSIMATYNHWVYHNDKASRVLSRVMVFFSPKKKEKVLVCYFQWIINFSELIKDKIVFVELPHIMVPGCSNLQRMLATS